MSLPTLKDLEKLPKIRFPAGNDIPYGEDFSFYRGIPSDVDWYIAEIRYGSASLVREGHGVKDHYGNGSLLVKSEHFWPSKDSLVLKKDERSGPVSSPPNPSPPHRGI